MNLEKEYRVETHIVGRGLPADEVGAVSGPLWRVEDVEDVLAVLESEDAPHVGAIALVPDAGATFLAPIFADLAGLICLNGTLGSHLAIVSRDFGTPALFSFTFDSETVRDGDEIRLDTVSGTVSVDR